MTADAPSDDAHISFAKRLAHNNRDTRQSALKKVTRWLVTRSQLGALDHTEMIKIWKGLHYSMWYSDKPLTQESLAFDISKIVSLLPEAMDGVAFFDGFCETIGREWACIDRQRLDKFYMFIKTALKCVLEFCAGHDWNEDVVTAVISVLDTRLINSTCPDSISVFISEHIYTIYNGVCNQTTSTLFITRLIMSYTTLLSKTAKKDLSRVITANLFTPLIKETVSVNIDVESFIKHITELAVQPGILTRNRKLLYKLRSNVLALHGGENLALSPLGKRKIEEEGGVEEGIENVQANGQVDVLEPEKKKKKRRKKKKKKVDSTETESMSNGESTGLTVVDPQNMMEKITEEEKMAVDEIVVGEAKPSEDQPGPESEPTEETPCEAVEETLGQSEPEMKKKKKKKAGKKVDSTETEPMSNGESTDMPVEEIEIMIDKIIEREKEDAVMIDKIIEREKEDAALGQTEPDKPKSNRRQSSRKAARRKDAHAPLFVIEDAPFSPKEEVIIVSDPKTDPTSADVSEITKSPKIEKDPNTQRSLRKRKKKSSLKTSTPLPTDTASTPTSISEKKKVRLSLENNEFFYFKKNASLDSPKPYDGTRTPTKGVLKSSPAMTRSLSRKRIQSRIKK